MALLAGILLGSAIAISGQSATANLSITVNPASGGSVLGTSVTGGSSALGWFALANTAGPACPGGQSGNCLNVVSAWGGGAADTVNNRLFVFGGGHSDYSGNEVYTLNLNASPPTFSRLNSPSASPATDCTQLPPPYPNTTDAQNADGTPRSRHTYGGLAFIPNEGGLTGQGALFVTGGSLYPCGGTASDNWYWDVATQTWTNLNPANGTLPAQIAQYQAEGEVAAYDPASQTIFVCDNTSMFQYIPVGTSNGVTPIVNTYNQVGHCSESTSGSSSTPWSATIDYHRHKMFIFGYNQINSFNLTNLGGSQQLNAVTNASGCPTSFVAPGVAYNAVLDKIEIWGGGNTIYLYNPDANSCTSQTFSGGPTCPSTNCTAGAQSNGTFGRMQYFPALDLTAIVNDWSANAYVLRLGNLSSGSTADQVAVADDLTRCNAPGVVVCQNFDTSSGFQQNINIYASDEGVFPSQDSTTAMAGSSMRIDIPPFQTANSGKYNPPSFTPIGGSNVDFYFQVSTRISPEMLSDYTNFGWPTWKNHGFYFGNTSCTGLMQVMGLSNSSQPGEPLIPEGTAGGCSAVALVTNGGVPPYYIQQSQAFPGWVNYQALYRSLNSTPTFAWPTNTWLTFYWHIRLGTFSSGGPVNWPGTLIESWVAKNGGPWRQWIYLPNFPFNGDGAGNFFESLELYPYMTGKDGSQGGYPTAHAWWDNLKVSSQPIAVPMVPPSKP
jgi:hypothetical protein